MSHAIPVCLVSDVCLTFLGLESCVLCAAQHAPNQRLDKQILYAALQNVIQSHPVLCVRVIGKPSQVPSFIRLKTVDLSEVVEFSEGEDLQVVFEKQFQRPLSAQRCSKPAIVAPCGIEKQYHILCLASLHC